MAKFKGFMEDYTGLDQTTIAQNQKKYGLNELTPEKKQTFLHKVISVILEPMFFLLIFTSFLYFLLGEPKDGLIMLISVIFIISIDIIQEWKTDKALQALKSLASPKVKVIRNEQIIEIESKDLTIDDLMIIEEGDSLAADGLIIEMYDLGVNESTLTGESDVVWKKLKLTSRENNNPWKLNYCYTGTAVTQGSAIVKVTAIGAQTEYGKIGTALASVTKEITPLEKQINRLIVSFAIYGLCLSLSVVVFTFINMNQPDMMYRIIHSILPGLTIAMGLIPEEFPVILTVFLALGAWRLARKNSLIRRMPSLETLGAVSVLCVDKTGTLTQNKMTVQEVYYHTYKKDDFLAYSVLSCEKEPYDPMEIAILNFTSENGVDNQKLFSQKLVNEYSFSSETKMMGHLWQIKDELHLAVKGSPESVLPLCQLSPKERQNIDEHQQRLASLGYRVIAVAKNDHVTKIHTHLHQHKLELLGLIGLEDPPRKAVPNAIATCYQAGIRVVMITGDNPITASSIAGKIGIQNNNQVLTEKEIDNLSDEELKAKVKDINIFARVVPHQKMRIIKALKDNGDIVAMTGDGVNDAPALKYADIGIAMGKRGTNVAKEASDMILLDDNFTTIVDTIKDGRKIYDNIKKAIGYIFVIHIPIALIALMAPAMGLPLLLLPVHIVMLELVIDPTCSIIFERQPAEPNIMRRKPRPKDDPLVSSSLIFKSLAQGLSIFIATFGSYVYLVEYLNWGVEPSRTLSLVVLITSSLFLVYVNHSNNEFAISGIKLFKDKIITTVNLAIVLALAIIIYTPYGNAIVKTVPLIPKHLFYAIGLAFLATFWWELIKLIKKLFQLLKN